MELKFWGVRGSIPTPGPETVIYGGNTTCIQVTADEGDIIIIDAGTGIRPLGLELLKSQPVNCSIFLTHTHWDHIQGLPFFAPFFVESSSISLYGPLDPVNMKSLHEILAVQMEYSYFPVRETELKADIHYQTLHELETVTINNTKITNILMNHPVLCYGYKIENNGKTLFFTGDHEPYPNIYSEADDDYALYQKIIDDKEQSIVDFIRGVDILVADSQYTENEYAEKVGWGHSTFDKVLTLAQKAEVERCFLTHHDPTRTDGALDKIMIDLKKRFPHMGERITLAREGETLGW